MHDDYLREVVRRGRELNRLERAAACLDMRAGTAVRWAVAAAFGLLVTLLPGACTAQAFFQII